MDMASGAASSTRDAFHAMYRAFLDRLAGERASRTDAEPGSDARLEPLPYPGLRSFTPLEGGFFFGREASVDALRERLARGRTVVLLGGSGSGKSSLIRAGLVPRLNSTKSIPGRTGNWYFAEFRPRLRPMHELADALVSLIAQHFPRQGSAAPAAADSRPGGASGPDLQALRTRLRTAFEGNGAQCGKALFAFVNKELAGRDEGAMRGRTAGRANLLLVIDQFEEVFRPEVDREESGGGRALLDMIVAVHDQLAAEPRDGSDTAFSGLFLAITMRSEELHRTTEHPGLARVVNDSSFLLDLLDPVRDEEDMRRAIVEPARRVMIDWGILDKDPPGDAPFADSVVAWLLAGAGRLSDELEHRPDQLPLLQHALQTLWTGAMLDWEARKEDADYTIRKEHLLGFDAEHDEQAADLEDCLDVRASGVKDSVVKRFVEAARALKAERATKAAGEAAVKAIFRSLARPDDRGNWTRRFARPKDVLEFFDADPIISAALQGSAVAGHGGPLLRELLREFVLSGYLAEGADGTYDISHESLVRNWRACAVWLRDPEIMARSLVRVVETLDPGWRDRRDDQLVTLIPHALVDCFAPAGGRVPQWRPPVSWASEQIAPVLKRTSIRTEWMALATDGQPPEPEAVLAEIVAACAKVRRIHRRRIFRARLVWAGGPAFAVLFLGVVGWNVWSQADTDESLRLAYGASRALEYVSPSTPVDGRARRHRDSLGVMVGDRALTSEERGDFRDSAWRTWDRSARNVGHLMRIDEWDGALPTGIDASAAQAYCARTGTRAGTERRPSLLPNQGRVTLDLSEETPRGFPIKLSVQRADGEIRAELTGFVPLPPNSRVCLSPDGMLITIASPGMQHPEVHELTWVGCVSARTCDRWIVSSFQTVPVPTRPDAARWFPCVAFIPPATGTPLLKQLLFYRTNLDAANCDSPEGESGTGFRAEYFPGAVWPRAVSESEWPGQSCRRQGDLVSGETRRWTCGNNGAQGITVSVRGLAEDPRIVLVRIFSPEDRSMFGFFTRWMRRRTSESDDVYWSDEILIPAGVEADVAGVADVGLAENGLLYLRLPTDQVLRLVANRAHLARLLEMRGRGERGSEQSELPTATPTPSR